MGKLYTLDEKLLISTPEIRIKDKIYPVDDRTKTVKKLIKMSEGNTSGNADTMDSVIKLALGEKAFREIEEMELPFKAYQACFELVTAAMTGEEPEEVAARFQDEKPKK